MPSPTNAPHKRNATYKLCANQSAIAIHIGNTYDMNETLRRTTYKHRTRFYWFAAVQYIGIPTRPKLEVTRVHFFTRRAEFPLSYSFRPLSCDGIPYFHGNFQKARFLQNTLCPKEFPEICAKGNPSPDSPHPPGDRTRVRSREPTRPNNHQANPPLFFYFLRGVNDCRCCVFYSLV